MASSLHLKPVDGPSADAVDLEPGRKVVIGRLAECEISLVDESVSRRHASIDWREVAWFVTDLDSKQGTMLCGERIEPHKPVILRKDDTLQIGRYTFSVVVAEETPESGEAGPTSVPDRYRTRASIFLRLHDDETAVRELSWEEFRKRYAPVIAGFARNCGLSAQDADDVLQDVMLAFFQVAPRFEYDPGKGRFRGYLKRITRQVVWKNARRAARAGIVSDEADVEVSDETDELWDRQWAEQVFDRAIREARERFAAKTMEAFELFARRKVPAEEVASRLGMSVNSVHHAKSRVQ